MGCHHKYTKCTFVEWINEPHSPELYHVLLTMLRLAQAKEIKVSDKEFQYRLKNGKKGEIR
jgi:hypothetical protein